MYNLKELKKAADEIIEINRNKPGDFCGEFINWHDLGCVIAEYAIDDEGKETHRVYIEEASPSWHQFQKFISEELHFRGWKFIEVITQW